MDNTKLKEHLNNISKKEAELAILKSLYEGLQTKVISLEILLTKLISALEKHLGIDLNDDSIIGSTN